MPSDVNDLNLLTFLAGFLGSHHRACRAERPSMPTGGHRHLSRSTPSRGYWDFCASFDFSRRATREESDEM